MREILFRGKSIYANTPNTPGYWLEGSLVCNIMIFEDKITKVYHIIKHDDYLTIELNDSTEVWPETVGQWTGLTDDAGKKIFDGDIIERIFHITSYFSESSTEKLIKPVYYQLGCYQPRGLLANHEKCKVIGNIHDNPKLMEEEK